jgi:hypothetical protein
MKNPNKSKTSRVKAQADIALVKDRLAGRLEYEVLAYAAG